MSGGLAVALQMLVAALVVHVPVALCDDAHQGIVPVPAAIGNGQNPRYQYFEPLLEAAAQAHHAHQSCGIKGARRLFWAAAF